MVQAVVETGFYVLCAYAAAGAAVSVALHLKGLARIDHATIGAKPLFRVLISPGLIALWPVMLVKWRKALRGENTAGPLERPVSAAGLRAIHGHLIRVIAVLTPVAVALAVATRPPANASETPLNILALLDAAGDVIAQESEFGGLPVTCRVRADAAGARQIELEGEVQLPFPSLAVYLIPAGADETPAEGIFLGAFWGPGLRRYEVPSEEIGPGSKLLLYSLADGDSVAVGRVPVAKG